MERRKHRQKFIKPLVDAYFNWIRINIDKVMPKSKTYNGMAYSLNQEKYFRRFLDDGEIPIDNNAAEQSIRSFCIGKKNWVMCDTINGAKSSAIIYSLVETAKANGCLVSFDPNLRPPLWSSLDLAKEQMEYGFGKCDILKISDNEIQFVSGKEDYDEGIAYLQETYNIPLILLTMGKDGSRAYYKGMRVERPGFSVKAIETTGAGDTFCGSSLNYLVDHDFENLTEEQLGEMLTFANAAAALVTTKKGAIKAMPVKEEVLELIQK